MDEADASTIMREGAEDRPHNGDKTLEDNVVSSAEDTADRK